MRNPERRAGQAGPTPLSPPRRHFLRAAGAVALLAGVPLPALAAPKGLAAPADLAGYRPEFALTDHNGRRRRAADFRGKVVLATFGYTRCPDVCPTTLLGFSEVMKLLGDDALRVQVLFITLDPARDTQATLAMYVPSFNPTFLGLRGDRGATARAATAFDVTWKRQPGQSSFTYTIDHTAASFVLDPQGYLRTIVAYGQAPGVLVSEIRHLLSPAPAF